MNERFEGSIPSFLEEPLSPIRNIAPPTQTRKQELPFGELTWEDFEKLCLRVARLEAEVEHCQLYGERGENQEGIDLYARKPASNKYTVYQCKREKNYTSAKIKEAVNKFLTGKWVEQTDVFVLCTKESLKSKKRADAFNEQSEILREKSISFLKWDRDELSIKLKDRPQIVDDFFGREWVKAFCGFEQAESLGVRVNLEPILKRYREWLNGISGYFKILGFNKILSIETNWIQLQASSSKESNSAFNADYITDAYRQVIVMGKSGSGKSILLQRIAHRLSSSRKQVLWVRLTQVAKYYERGEPFANAILIDAAENSGIDINQLKQGLANLDYLLADGLDECDASVGVIAKQLVEWLGGHSNTRIIATTRPDNYNPEILPGWETLTLLSLAPQDIKQSFRQLLKTQFTNDQIEIQLTLFEQQLKANKTAAIAAQNPLLLGFLIQLSINNIGLSQNRAGLYESIIELSYEQSPSEREFKVELDFPTALHLLEATGWILQTTPGVSEHKLVEEVGKKLSNELDLKPLAAKKEAQKGLNFWKERRVIECQRIAHQNTVTFVHLSLQEYAAGRYAANLLPQKQRDWLMQIKQEPKWHEVILFAAGVGAAEQIVNYLLSVDTSDELISGDLVLAAEALAEAQTPQIELIDEVVRRLQVRLESQSSDIAFDAAEALALLASKAPDAVGVVAKSLFNHIHLWTRLSAMKLAIECGDKYVNLEVLSKLLDDIIVEPAQALDIFDILYDHGKKKYRNWEFQNQIVCQGFQLLLKKQPDLTVANQVWDFISRGGMNVGTCQVLRNLLFDILPEKLKDENPQEYRGWYSIFWNLTRPDRIWVENTPEKLLKNLRQVEKTKLADQVFLEAVLRAASNSEDSLLALLKEQPRSLAALGILYTGMGWWKIATSDWDRLSENEDMDAVEAVLKGIIAALDIDADELAMDAMWLLNKLKSSTPYNLEAIKTQIEIEKIENNAQKRNLDYLNQILTIAVNDEYRYLYHQVEKISVSPKWQLLKKYTFDSEKLIRALKHPSQGIQHNAALLLLNGAGGDQAADLVRKLLKNDS